MKKVILMTVCASLMLTSCGTYTGSGAWVGGSLGTVLGSAIGGIAGGPRGSDIGTIVGMAGGAVLGGTIGNQADEKRQADLEQYKRDRAERVEARRQRQDVQQDIQPADSSQENETYEQSGQENSGFDSSNGGDDRIYDFTGSDYNGSYSAQEPTTTVPEKSSVEDIAGNLEYTPNLEIRNARFVDDNQDGLLSSNEVAKVIFEVYNRDSMTVYDVIPTVVETTENRHIYISPSIHIEKIAPGQGVRYTAVVKADGKLKNGTARFCASVLLGNKAISKVSEFNIPTRR